MRDVIALALAYVLRLVLPSRGRHAAAPVPAPEPAPESARVSPWDRPWPTPTPEHIKTLHTPLRGDDVALTRPYVTAETTMALGVIRERRRAAELATMGVDYPYSYPGDHFQEFAFATAGVSA